MPKLDKMIAQKISKYPETLNPKPPTPGASGSYLERERAPGGDPEAVSWSEGFRV